MAKYEVALSQRLYHRHDDSAADALAGSLQCGSGTDHEGRRDFKLYRFYIAWISRFSFLQRLQQRRNYELPDESGGQLLPHPDCASIENIYHHSANFRSRLLAYQSACIAAEGRERIFVVDTMSASIGSGILARYAIDNAHLHAGELAALLDRRRQDVCIIGLVDTLEYLKKGGRISKTAAFAGGLLNIHPVLTLTDGEVTIIGKARGSRQGNNLLVQKIHESGGIDFSMPLLLGYSGLSDALLQKYVADSAPLWENGTEALESVCIGSVIGTHAGPGAVVAAFFRRGGK